MRSFCLQHIFSIALIFTALSLSAQERKPLNPDVYDSWNAIDRPEISRNGNMVTYEINPQYGDGQLIIHRFGSAAADTVARAYQAAISAESGYTAFRIKALLEQTRKAKVEGKKKDDLPGDSLGILTANGKRFLYPGLKSFSVPLEGGASLFALFKDEKPGAKEAENDTLAGEEKQEKPSGEEKQKSNGRKKDKTETFLLRIINPTDSLIAERPGVTHAAVSKNGKTIVYASYTNDSLPFASVSMRDEPAGREIIVFSGTGSIGGLALSSNGRACAFLHSSDTIEAKRYSLYLFENGKLSTIADTAGSGDRKGLSPSPDGSLYFSGDNTLLYFGFAPAPKQMAKDTIPEDEKARVDIWHWRDPALQPQQLKQLEKNKKRTWQAVYHTGSGKTVQLADSLVPDVTTGFRGNGRYALGMSGEHYQVESSWRGQRFRDVWLIDNETGKRTLLLRKHNGPVSLANNGRFLAWYSQNDSLWHTMNLKDMKSVKHQSPEGVVFYDEEHDVPGLPGPAGYAGWTSNDTHFVVYDRYDLWALDPDGKEEPRNLTFGEGRKEKRKFRYVNLEKELPYVGNRDGSLLLSSFSETTKASGFALLDKELTQLTEAPYRFSTPLKAEESNRLIWTKGNFNEFPDLWTGTLRFDEQVKLSDANPQQKEYRWGSVEPVEWTAAGGQTLQGLLYKPEDFDPSEKYPMLVYFYEKYSDMIHQHYPPRPSRSIISPSFCASNGYLVFIPDITYVNGYPGQSSYESVVSGTLKLISEGYVDKDRIGIQGQSWGGYQVAWLITRTNLFKAAMAGAPVSNMTSAYGGIRWESGMVRQFQYEEGQSRIGASLWERPDLYIENSPLFRADRIETPLLIMANDGDGAVPWYQGIELFTAMRRLEKPCWMLNYNDDEHNLSKRANMKDLDKRMMQFFDHYLKDAPAPEWMTKGVPALEKGKNDGFGINN